jgi:hypothetical protein
MVRDDLLLLVGEIRESQSDSFSAASPSVLERLQGLYESYEGQFGEPSQRDIRDAVLLAEILCNTYTCVETILFRIARQFENHLDPQQWHKELLQKMRIEVPGVRRAVLSRETYRLLDELRRFRHFKRYYYEFDDDWRRLDYLRSVYDQVRPLIRADLQEYVDFLLVLADE